MKVPSHEELLHLKIQAAMRENSFQDTDLKYLGERAGHHWYLIDGQHKVSTGEMKVLKMSMKIDTIGRIVGSFLVVTAYFIILHVNLSLGVIMQFIGDAISVPFFIRTKSWDVSSC